MGNTTPLPSEKKDRAEVYRVQDIFVEVKRVEVGALVYTRIKNGNLKKNQHGAKKNSRKSVRFSALSKAAISSLRQSRDVIKYTCSMSLDKVKPFFGYVEVDSNCRKEKQRDRG